MGNKEKIEQLATWIEASDYIVFFGGAGTSTESGIPDFRSAAGLYQNEQQSPYPPEVMLSYTFFKQHPEVFYDFYRSKMLHPDAQPNGCHRLLAKLEADGKLKATITQNIDGLHQSAGCTEVMELHGSVHRNYCMDCSRFYGLHDIQAIQDTVPRCLSCGGLIKPDVVLYEEELDQNIILRSIQEISTADLLIIGGTSLTVHPAAGLISYFQGSKVALLNADPTPYDHRAGLLIADRIGEVMNQVDRLIHI
ncbi:NAD-dependent protein deacylase [Paenibacillus sp. JCM 10914]|uniref:NAD-dependent protein deacylase n=1 Tax=Paenibacillus sp. JCM 10914 TaxID=1236974 RepID=UPI0003CC514B|nr:NAD-dependent protein deacylase [Paenibacillus sp. JCM 10914]GAE04044.1 NAD-dependent protein deacetylase of SIR2 family [Paenibacillus sp. JCM 10914]